MVAALDTATFLQDNGFGTVNTDIFSRLIDRPDKLIAVDDYSVGGEAQITFSTQVYILSRRVQILSRDTNANYEVNSNRIEDIWDLMQTISETTINGTRYAACVPVDVPVVLDRDEKERTTFVANFILTKERRQ